MATHKYVDSVDNLYKLQWDALYESIEDNTYLPYSTSSLRNKSLNTTNKRIIKAINEILTTSEKASSAVDSFVERFNNVIGNEIIDPTLLAQLQEIDENFFKAILKINSELQTLKNDTSINEEVQKAIDELNSKIAKLETQEYIANHEEYPTVDVVNQTFTLENYPRTKESIHLYINGIYYPTKCFDIDDKTLLWNCKENNEGFDIEESFEVCVRYDYIPTIVEE